ncbi:ubiquitin carboxyl-terminal hydrolase 36 isoform X2 [Armigeres subalbatus]|uniref:ubiquitin carboxyl-terminal hydrolase 36 isoform X2 n=1 Tax=Armigeres subalbatus TaxID=124917 RepID=UPI002ED6A812
MISNSRTATRRPSRARTRKVVAQKQRFQRGNPFVLTVPPTVMLVVRLVKRRFLLLYRFILRFVLLVGSLFGGISSVGRIVDLAEGRTISNLYESACEPVIDADDMNDGNNSSSAATGKDQLPAPKRVLYPRENVQIGWKATGHKWNTGAGFTNVGNTCYLNSTLQALFHVPAIANWLISDSAHRERCDDNVNGQGCIICAMAKTLLASQSNQGSVKPYMVVSKLRLVCKHLIPGRQEDAHEFLRYLVEAMEKCYLARFKNSKELDQYSKETTPLNQILGGYLRSEVKCLSCQHVSTTFQHFEDLLLDIRKVNSIEEALTTYFARERLEEMQYKCEACKKKVAATKQFSLERAPFALCIQLKRFSMMGGKINKHVELKTRLDLTPYSSKSAVSSGKLTYKLVSMVTHLGSTQHCGHYTAIGGTETGTYYVFDDSLVRPITLQNVTSTNAYIIFYELESVQNGIKSNASSTATSASFANTYGSSSGKYGSNFEGGSNTGGASSHTSPLRVHGPGSNAGHNPLIPSKLENRSNFIGPMLPQQTQEKTKKLANGMSHLYVKDEGEAVVTSSRASPISSTTSSLSSPSPVKQSCPNGPSSSPSKFVRNSTTSNMKSKYGSSSNSNGFANPVSNYSNGSLKSSSSSAASSSTTSYSLPSMPKLCNSSAAAKNFSGESGESSSTAKGAGFPGHSKNSNGNVPNGHHNGNKSVSLVPYDADDDDDDDEEENQENQKRFVGSKKRNGRNHSAEDDDDDDSDEDVERIQSHVLLGPSSNNNRLQRPSDPVEEEYSPKSPPVIKTKAGLWKVSDNRHQTSSSSSANSSKNTSPATSGNSSPANYGHMNGNSGGPLASGYQPNNRQYNGFNGYNGNSNNSRNGNGNDVVNQLHQYSHQGYGAPVRSWNGQQTNMNRELSNERREERKRQFEDDCDTEMDRGRTKKVKTHFYHQQQRQQQQSQNPFQMHQMMNGGNGANNNVNRKWNNNNQFGGKFFQNRGGNYYQNGNHPRNHNGFRNGRHGRNGFYNKSHHHHQRDKF